MEKDAIERGGAIYVQYIKNEEIFPKIPYSPTAVHSWGESDPLESVSNLTWVKCSLQQERWDWNRKTVSNLRNISKLGFFSLSDSCEEKYWKFFLLQHLLSLLTCLLASLPDEGEELFKINFSVPISVYLAKQPSHLCVQSKVVKRFRQGWKYIPEGKVFLLRHLLIRRRGEKQVCARTWSFKSLVSIYYLISF